MLAGPLPAIYGPTGPGKLLFAFFAAMAETERENIPESTLEGLDTAARKGKHGGRPPVITADMLHTVLRRPAGGESVEQIQPDLIIPTGRRKGRNPSVASIYRALAEHAKHEAYPEALEAAHADFAALKAGDVPARVRRTSRSPPGTSRSSSSKRAARPSPANGPTTLRPAHVPRLGRDVGQPGQRSHSPHRSQRRLRTRTQDLDRTGRSRHPTRGKSVNLLVTSPMAG